MGGVTEGLAQDVTARFFRGFWWSTAKQLALSLFALLFALRPRFLIRLLIERKREMSLTPLVEVFSGFWRLTARRLAMPPLVALEILLLSMLPSVGCASDVEMQSGIIFPPRPDYIPKEIPPCITWDQKSLVSPYYPCPGQKLGFPKDEASALLLPEVKTLMDGILRLYNEPGLIADYKKILVLLNLVEHKRYWFDTNYGNGNIRKSFRGHLAGGILDRPAWQGIYFCCGYPFSKDGADHSRTNRLLLTVDTKIECINSRAVEGYLDLYFHPYISSTPPPPPELWYRHGRAGSVVAYRRDINSAGIQIGFIKGCLSQMELGGKFENGDYEDEYIYN